jgi:small neutral amino acid transporter SnatA (MarC family)
VIHRLLRPSGVELLIRIAGLLLSAIAVQRAVGAIRAVVSGGQAEGAVDEGASPAD